MLECWNWGNWGGMVDKLMIVGLMRGFATDNGDHCRTGSRGGGGTGTALPTLLRQRLRRARQWGPLPDGEDFGEFSRAAAPSRLRQGIFDAAALFR